MPAELAVGFYRTPHEPQIVEACLAAGVTRFDTAFNYASFGSHRDLGVLLRRCDPDQRASVSTKVGIHPDGHSIAPDRIVGAVERAADELGRPPGVVFVHNPEWSIEAAAPGFTKHLERALEALDAARERLEIAAVGLSVWDARRFEQATAEWVPPAELHLMTRVGLLVSSGQRAAIERVRARLGVDTDRWWGMSPLGGRNPAWALDAADMRALLGDEVRGTPAQEALRCALHIDRTTATAVGVRDGTQLHELVEASRWGLSEAARRRVELFVTAPG